MIFHVVSHDRPFVHMLFFISQYDIYILFHHNQTKLSPLAAVQLQNQYMPVYTGISVHLSWLRAFLVCFAFLLGGSGYTFSNSTSSGYWKAAKRELAALVTGYRGETLVIPGCLSIYANTKAIRAKIEDI